MLRRILRFFVAHGSQARGIGGVGHTTACKVGTGGGLHLFKHYRLNAQVVCLGVIRQIFLGGRAGLHAYGLVFQLLGVFHPALHGHHKALAVVVRYAGRMQAERAVARERKGGVAREDVHFARLQCRKPLLRIQWNVLHLLCVAQGSSGDGAAYVHVQAAPLAV